MTMLQHMHGTECHVLCRKWKGRGALRRRGVASRLFHRQRFFLVTHLCATGRACMASLTPPCPLCTAASPLMPATRCAATLILHALRFLFWNRTQKYDQKTFCSKYHTTCMQMLSGVVGEMKAPGKNATNKERMAWVHWQLDQFDDDHLLLDRFQSLGPAARRQGGASSMLSSGL